MNTSMAEKGQKFKTLLVLAIVTILSLGVFLFRGSQVVLIVDGNAFEVVTNAKTVGELADEEDIIKENAYIDLNLDSKIEKGLEIEVKNPKTYTIDVNGLQMEVTSVHTEVKDILKDAGVEVALYDYTEPYLTESIPSGETIKYFHVDLKDEVVETSLPFQEKEVKNNKLEKGKKRVAQEGKEGLKKTEIEHKYVNGTLEKSTIQKEVVVTEPVDKIIEIGTKEPKPVVARRQQSQPSRGSARNVIVMNARAYDLSYESTGKRPGDRGYGLTASGTKARPGVASVDPRVIPLGTKLYIESLDGRPDYGYAVAEDTGGAIKGNKIDLFFSSRSEALRFGRRNVRVHILN